MFQQLIRPCLGFVALAMLAAAPSAVAIEPGTPEDYADFIDKDEKKWSQLIKTSGVEQE